MKTPQSPAPVAGRPLTAEDVAELKRLAEAATPGPWKACGTIYEHMNCEVRSGRKGEGQAIAQVWDGPNAFKDGQWIAAASPAAFLALIAENERLSRPASEQPVEASGAGREEKLHPHAQPFESYPELASHIERMAMSGVIGSLISWEAFLRELNAALSPASPARTPMGGTGWIVSNGSETKWRSWDQGGSIWVDSPDKATRYARREDAELVHAEDEDAWCIKPYHQHDFHPDPKSGIRICADPECRKVERKADRTSVHLEHEAGCLPRGAISGDTNGQTVWLDGFTGGAHRLGIWGGLTLRFVEGDGSEVCRSYVDDALAAPTPMGGEVEALREAVEKQIERFADFISDGDIVEVRVSRLRRWAEDLTDALAASSPSPAQGGSRYTTLADLHTIKGWLHGLSTHPDLEDVVADGGVTAGMVYQQEAREFAGRIGRILAAPPSVQPVKGK